ncbi:MAG: hypothetical protein ACPLYD_15865 [Anaerolineae bacterium]
MLRSQPGVQATEMTWEELLRLLVERPDWLARVRQVVLTPDLLSLPEAVRDLLEAQRETTFQIQELREAQRQTTEQIRELVETQRQHEARLTRVEERLDRLEATVQDLVEAQRQTNLQIQELREAQHQTNLQIQELREAIQRNTSQITDLTEVARNLAKGLERLDGTVGDIKGDLLEIRYRERPYAYFGYLLKAVQAVPLWKIEGEVERYLTEEELVDLLRLDLLLHGRVRTHPEHPEVWLAVEVSSVVDKGDVERAGRRAAFLRRAGFRAIPVVAGLGIREEARREAETGNVVVVKDGQALYWSDVLPYYLGEDSKPATR